MKNKMITEKFIKFLKSKKVYSKFVKNYKADSPARTIKGFVDECLITNCKFIGGAFSWDKTPEGFGFWVEILNEWETIKNEI